MDASVAAKWIFAEPYSSQAVALIVAASNAADRVVAPPLLPIEMTNIVWKQMRRSHLSLSDGIKLFTVFRSYPVALKNPPGLSERALTLTNSYNLPASYDAHYVALAEMLGCDLWTDDQALLRLLAGKLPFVKWIGAY